MMTTNRFRCHLPPPLSMHLHPLGVPSLLDARPLQNQWMCPHRLCDLSLLDGVCRLSLRLRIKSINTILMKEVKLDHRTRIRR